MYTPVVMVGLSYYFENFDQNQKINGFYFVTKIGCAMQDSLFFFNVVIDKYL